MSGGAGFILSRHPTGVRPGGAGSASVSDDQAAESAARAGPWGHLETVQKVCTDR